MTSGLNICFLCQIRSSRNPCCSASRMHLAFLFTVVQYPVIISPEALSGHLKPLAPFQMRARTTGSKVLIAQQQMC